MNPKLLVAAAIGLAFAFSAAPGAAQQHHGRHHTGVRHVQFREASTNALGRSARAFDAAAAWGYDLQSSFDDRDWAPGSGNGWWHDRPDRAYPRWVQEQRGRACDPDRMWWSGSGWHC